MSWNVTRCSFLPPNKTPPPPAATTLLTTSPPTSPAPQPTVAASPTGEAMLITHYLSDPSLGHGVPWWWVTDEMEVVCVCVCDQVLGVWLVLSMWGWKSNALSTIDCYPYHHECGRDPVDIGVISHISLTQRAWPSVKCMYITSLCDYNNLLVGLSIASLELAVLTS